jgi:hypothetical protein
VGRSQGTETRRTIYKDYKDAFGEWIANENKQDGYIELINGSGIQFIHLWDDEKGVDHLNAYNISCFLISQAEQVPKAVWQKLLDRSRRKGVGGKVHRHAVTNKPIGEGDYLRLVEGNPNNRDWVYDEFVAGAEEKQYAEEVQGKKVEFKVYRKPDHILVNCQSANYSFVPSDYVETITANAPQRYIDRYVKGMWTAHSGLVYSDVLNKGHYSEPYNIRKDMDRARFVRIIGFDWGLRDPTGMLWAIYDRLNDTYLCYRESYENNLTLAEQAERLVEMSGDEKVDVVIADTQIWNREASTGKAMVEEIQKVFLKHRFDALIVPASKDIEAGVLAVTKYLKTGKIVFFRTLRALQGEFDTYRYPEDVDVKEPIKNLLRIPLDKNNHLMDPLRYIIYTQEVYRRELNPISRPERQSMEWDGSRPVQPTEGLLAPSYHNEGE